MGGEHHFEFFGPHGPAVLVLALPIVVYGLVVGCNSQTCLQLFPNFQLPTVSMDDLNVYSHEGMLAALGWFALVLLLHVLLPGKTAQTTLRDGSKLTYKLNALLVFLVTYSAALVFGVYLKWVDLGWMYDNFVTLLTGSMIVSITLSVYVYATSFKKGALLALGGDSGYPAYDFWMGRELNPRVLGIDLKEFCELYPGLIGWVILNLGMLMKQYEKVGYVTNSMYMINAFQLYYVIDGLWNEKSILSTMDITTDGFGYMLSFGDLTWVPFTFATATRYLVDYPQQLSMPAVALILGVKLVGYIIFRGANGQKDTFRTNPNNPSVSHLKTLKTERGTQLIISGWWGVARHINYFGDWIMGLAWCMPTGLEGAGAVVPYFYCIYFASLLVHREMRDEESCRAKYGKDWDKYCALVKWRIVPYVY